MSATTSTIAIIGYGFVGQAMHRLFPNACVYDIDRRNVMRANLPLITIEDANKCSVAFICVPTPCHSEGPLDTSAVEEIVAWCTCPLIVIRSTVNPGTCGELTVRYHRDICYQPEYLGESPSHPFVDMKARPFLIIGGARADRRKLIELYATVYNANIRIRQMTNYEAEVVKLSENRAIAWKVAQCQELYDACEAAGIDYYTIREAVYGDDPRFDLWWSFIYPDKRGFDGKCLPKDVYAWAAWAESVGASAEVTRAILERNKVLLAGNKVALECH